MTGLSDLFRALFFKTGPRREATEAMAEEVNEAVRQNRSAVDRNQEAVRRLIRETLDGMEGRHGRDHAHH